MRKQNRAASFKIRTMLSDSRTPVGVNAARILYKESVSNVSKLYVEIKKIPGAYQAIFPVQYPRRHEDIKSKSVRLLPIGFDKTIVLISLCLEDNAVEINNFVTLEEEYQRLYLKENYKSCLNILDRIDSEICHSLWVLEKRIILKQKMYGLKEQKELTAKLIAESNGETPFILSTQSYKSEEKPSYNWYVRQIEKALETNLARESKNYFLYKTIGLDRVEIKDLSDVLLLETNSSIIDLYVAFIRVLQHYFSISDHQSSVVTPVKNVIVRIDKKINDSRLSKLRLCLDEDYILGDVFNESYLNVFENYTIGNYLKCKNDIRELFISGEFDVGLAEVYSKCCLRLRTPPGFDDEYVGKIIKSMISIIEKSDDFYLSYGYLQKEFLINKDLNYSHEIFSFLLRQANYVRGYYGASNNIGYLNAKYISPITSGLSEVNGAKKQVLERMKDKGLDASGALYQALLNEGDKEEYEEKLKNIPAYRINKIKGDRFFFEGDYKKATEFYAEVCELEDDITKMEVIGNYSMSCMDEVGVEKSCELISSSYVKNKNTHMNLPIEHIVNKIGDYNWPTTVDLPIVFYMYSENIKKDKMEHLRYSFEYFLTENSILFPSQIKVDKNSKDFNKYVFFLENICTYEVMKRYTPLGGTNDTDKERINILNLLKTLVPNDSEKYLKEIRGIAKNIVVKEGVKSVSKSKIYVDTESIKSKLKADLSEDFERYKTLLKAGVLENNPSDLLGLLRAIGEPGSEINKLVKKSREMDSLLANIIYQILDEFSNGEFGLNHFLSSRIRHGTLHNTLSNPLMSEKLLSTKDEDLGVYTPNEYWLSRFSFDKNDRDSLSDIFSHFSERFYEIVDDLKNNKIQISIAGDENVGNDKSLFVFSVFEVDVSRIKSLISEDMEYDKFMDIVFEFLWVKVEGNLRKVKAYFKDEMLLEFRALFEGVVEKINGLPYESNAVDLKASFNRSRMKLISTISEVSEWFHRSEVLEVNDFSANIPLEIAEKMICGIDGNSHFKINSKIDEGKSIKGRYLISFVDVIYPLLDNVISKSNITNEMSTVDFSIVYRNGKIYLSMKNTCLYNDNYKKINSMLKSKIKDHLQDKSIGMLSKEGGTGFYKIIKAVRNGLGSEIYDFKAGYTSNTEFSVDIIMKSEGLIA